MNSVPLQVLLYSFVAGASPVALGATLVEFDMEPFYETARLLYEGPWVAERYLAIRDLLASSPDAIHPVTREIIAPGARMTAAETFSALYRLQAVRNVAAKKA